MYWLIVRILLVLWENAAAEEGFAMTGEGNCRLGTEEGCCVSYGDGDGGRERAESGRRGPDRLGKHVRR